MPSLHDLLSEAQQGEAIAILGREFGLSPQSADAAVTALLPAISAGLKQSTATPEGLGNLFAVMGREQDLQTMYDDPEIAFTEQGRAAGEEVLSTIFGSPDVSRAIAVQAGQFSGVESSLLKKILPVIAGIVLSGLMGGKSKSAAPTPAPAPEPGNVLGDILGQIFGRGAGPAAPQQQAPIPTGAQPGADGGDLLGQILREFQKGLQDGRIKPVIIEGGPFQIPWPGGEQSPQGGGGQAAPSPAPQAPGGDVLGQILREILGGGRDRAPGGQAQREQAPNMKELSDRSRGLGVMGNIGEQVFGDRFEVGREVEQQHLDDIQRVIDSYFGSRQQH